MNSKVKINIKMLFFFINFYVSQYNMEYSKLDDNCYLLDDIEHLLVPQLKEQGQEDYEEYLQYYLENYKNNFYLYNNKSKISPILFGKKTLGKVIIYSDENNKVAELIKKHNDYILKINNTKSCNTILLCQYKNRNTISIFDSEPRKVNIKIPKNRFFYTNDVDVIKKLKYTIIDLKSKKPNYCAYSDEYRMKFINAKLSSVKNFQLINKNKTYFELGKLKKKFYSINFKYPFSILQIFGIALSAF